jgi:FAD/FMN-containing dehydrogenase
MSEIRGVDRMSQPLEAKDIRALAGTLSGSVLEPVDPGYDESRRIWNGMIHRRPALIARCVNTADVVTAVNFARATGVVVSVRGGDHSTAGNAVCEGGMMIDLSLMKALNECQGRSWRR